VDLWHAEAEDELGVKAVPSLVFDDSLALLVRLGSDVEGTGAARRLLDAVTALVALDVRDVRSSR
jgi:predicted DsbA family dithiol-disulfide isomerase